MWELKSLIKGNRLVLIYFLELVVLKGRLITFATLFRRNGRKIACFWGLSSKNIRVPKMFGSKFFEVM